jgi:hypothetical protein
MKKGSFTSDLSFGTIAAIIILVSGFLVVWNMNILFDKRVEISQIEADALLNRIFYSDKCLIYENGVRGYPGIISISKFEKNNLEKCIYLIDSNLGLNLKLYDLDGNKIGDEIVINDYVADNIHFCDLKNKNFDCYSSKNYVLIEEGGSFRSGILNIGIVVLK